MKSRIISVLLLLCTIVQATCPDYTNNPYYNHVETDEEGVEWVDGSNRPRTA